MLSLYTKAFLNGSDQRFRKQSSMIRAGSNLSLPFTSSVIWAVSCLRCIILSCKNESNNSTFQSLPAMTGLLKTSYSAKTLAQNFSKSLTLSILRLNRDLFQIYFIYIYVLYLYFFK